MGDLFKKKLLCFIFILIGLLLIKNVLSSDNTNIINFIDDSAVIDSGDINMSLVAAYNILGLDYAKSLQSIKITNNELMTHEYTIVISYPEHAHFENIKLSNNSLSIIEINTPLNFQGLLNNLNEEVIPPNDYSFTSYNISIPTGNSLQITTSITHDNVDSKKWYISVLGSSGSSSLLYTSGSYNISDVKYNVWWRKIGITSNISSNTILDFPHFIDGDEDHVNPARVEWYENNSLVSLGYKWGGNSDELIIDANNNTEVNWKIPIDLIKDNILMMGIGKKINLSGSETIYETRNKTVIANISIGSSIELPRIAKLNITGYNLEESKSVGGCNNDGGCGPTCGSDVENCCGGFRLYQGGGGWCKADSNTYTYTAWSSTTPSCTTTCNVHICTATCGLCPHYNPNGQIIDSTPGHIQIKCNDGKAEVCRWDSGSGEHRGTLSLSGSNTVTFATKNITFNISSTEIFSSSTWMLNNESKETNDFNASLIKGINNLTFTSQTKGEFYIYFEKQDDDPSIFVEGDNKFYIKNSTNSNVAYFDDNGNIVLKNNCTSGGVCTAPADSFIIKDNTGNTTAYVDSSGNLCIETGDCSDESASCNPTNDAFIIQNSTGYNMSYIDVTGYLCLTGMLIENGNP